MATKLRPIGHEDRLSVVDHLDELRTRLMIAGITLAIAFGFCFWQNGKLLELLNRPLELSTPTAQNSGKGRLAGVAAAQTKLRVGVKEAADALARVARSPRIGSSADRRELSRAASGLKDAAAALPRTVPKRRPITTGVGEPFTATLTVSLYTAVLISLPILLYQLYAFLLPALAPSERRVALPIMLAVPFLFVAGVAFAYLLVLPPAIKFLQNFNDDSFDVLLQARDYYKFEIFTMLALGLCFQVPIGMFALGRVGIINRGFLTRNWRYAIVIIAVLAALLPGVDPVTTLLEMVPLLMLYGVSIFLVPVAQETESLDEDPVAARASRDEAEDLDDEIDDPEDLEDEEDDDFDAPEDLDDDLDDLDGTDPSPKDS